MCWIMPTKSTLQVMTGITHWMKKAGFVVTLVPMSTAVYTGEPDTSPKQVRFFFFASETAFRLAHVACLPRADDAQRVCQVPHAAVPRRHAD